MPVTKQRQAAGSFSINLDDSTPDDVIQSYAIASKGFGHVLILPADVDPAWMTASQLYALSIYTGVYRREAGDTRLTTLSGAHASIWLGDEDGKGDLGGAGTNKTQGFVAWVGDIKPAQLNAGTVTATGGNQLWNYQWNHTESSPRQALDYICSLYSAEWEVTDALALNAGTASAVYGSPGIFVSPYWQGRDAALTGLRATIGYSADVEDYNRKIRLIYNSGASVLDSTNGADHYKDGLGAVLSWKRKVDTSNTTDTTNAQAIANDQNSRFNQVRKALTVRTDTDMAMVDVRCGAYIYAWNPYVDVYDFANEITFRGEVTWPLITRVEGITMNITGSPGVVFIDGDSNITNLTRYVVPENAGATLQVGAPIRNLKTAMGPTGSIPRT